MSQQTSLWDAVDKLVAPTRVKIDRQEAVESAESWLIRAGADPAGACWVPGRAKVLASHRSASAVWATVPSLWDQSTIALYGAEAAAGRGSKPLRERSVADLNLMEIRAQTIEGIRDVQQKLADAGKCEEPSAGEFQPREVRHVASLVQRHQDGYADEFAFRLTSWARALETYLNAGEHESRPVRLRGCPCPTCGTRQVLIDRDGNITAWTDAEDHHGGDRTVASALVIRFGQDGQVRAAECEACGDGWFRGEDLERLAQSLGIGLYAPTTPAAAEAG